VIQRVLRFCQTIARYSGPNRAEALELLDDYPTVIGAVKRAFELGYKRGYADAGAYIAEWIEEEDG